ncbi:hypothetical protein [Pseudoxanthomonas sacheonensis]|uniref:hypothetical protein n=1 Tax=Pseudoxanthomonas sacheonensis TaxID=443615 RepID=UPI0013D83785|nr:hypothetical protein [Pseudoxanthomonas sacheonensis]KAF1706254.1 hypothetical protein CSC73_16235 [Pseudoxanthomonas sacheonensis]
MKTPNDKKQLNSGGGSLGQFYRSREQMMHVSKRFIRILGPEYLPLHGETYNVGRNATKRDSKTRRFV